MGDTKNKSTVDTKSLVSSDPMALYMAQVNKYKLLSKEEEQELAIRYYETKDPEAAEKLVTANLRFVVQVAHEYSKFGLKLIDLVQEGNVGLMHAVREFNPYKGVRLITYAVWWIRGYIREYLLKQHSLVKIGTTAAQKKLFYNLKKEQERIEALGEEPTVQLLSQNLGVEEKDVELMQQRLSSKDVSLDQTIDSEDRTRLLDLQTSDSDDSVDEVIARQQDLHLLEENIDRVRNTLNEKELFILEHRLLNDSPMTLQEIGNHFGITRERTRQLEARVIKKLRDEYTSVR